MDPERTARRRVHVEMRQISALRPIHALAQHTKQHSGGRSGDTPSGRVTPPGYGWL